MNKLLFCVMSVPLDVVEAPSTSSWDKFERSHDASMSRLELSTPGRVSVWLCALPHSFTFVLLRTGTAATIAAPARPPRRRGKSAASTRIPCAILSALSRPLPAPAINAFLRLPRPTRAEFLEGRGLDEDLALDELCQLGLKDLLPPTREARVESFEDDVLILNISYL